MQNQMLIALCCSSAQESEGKALEIIFYEQSVSHKKKRGEKKERNLKLLKPILKASKVLYGVPSAFQNDNEDSVGCRIKIFMSPGNFKAHLQSSNSLLNVLFHNYAFCMVSALLSWLLAFFFLFLMLGTICIWLGKYLKSSHGL